MPTKYWLGNAAYATQVTNLTPANVEIGDVFTATFTDEKITAAVAFTATAATVANVTAGLAAAIAADTREIVRRVTPSDQTTYLRLTAVTSGRPFTVTPSTTNGGAADTQTLTATVSTASSGPNDMSCPANWSGLTLPTTSDDVIFEGSAADALFGLNALTGISLGPIIQTGDIKLGRIEAGQLYYAALKSTSVSITGTSTLVAIDVESASNATITVNNTAAPPSGQDYCVYLKGTDIQTVPVLAGYVGIAAWPGDTATLDSSGIVSGSAGAIIGVGSGATVTGVTLKLDDATAHLWASVPTITTGGASRLHQWAGNWTTGTFKGTSIAYVYGAVTCTTTTTDYQAVVDGSVSFAAKTLTTWNHYGRSLLYDPYNVVTVTTENDYGDYSGGRDTNPDYA